MTTDLFTPAPGYTIFGTGPYAVPHPYIEGAITAEIIAGFTLETLTPGTDFTVQPGTVTTAGSLFLSGARALAHEGQTLRIRRDTAEQQGWQGVLGEREKGLERQLDLMTMALQEHDAELSGALRLTEAVPPMVPAPDTVFTLDANGQPQLLPKGSFPPGPPGEWTVNETVVSGIFTGDGTLTPRVLPFAVPSTLHVEVVVNRTKFLRDEYYVVGNRLHPVQPWPYGARIQWTIQRPFSPYDRLPGPPGPTGPRGPTGPKGDPGNYLGLTLNGTGTSLAARPADPGVDGYVWGLIAGETIRLYLWDDTAGLWYDLGPLTNPAAFPVDRVIYIQGNGSNLNSGSSLSTAVRHIERALELAALEGGPCLIEWYPDPAVVTQGHLDVPDDCVIVAKHRTVFVRPAATFEERNVFRLGSGCFLEGVMFEDWRLNSLTDPTEGFAVSFRPGAVINRVPYAHKIAVRTAPSWGLVPPPLDALAGNPFVPRGGGVVLADGMVCSPYSRFPNIMTWGATPVTPNGIGYCARNGGLVNAVNAVSMWSHKHFLAKTGGQIILSACSTQFGDYAMHADGYRDIVVPGTVAAYDPDLTAATAIAAAATGIVDAMWNALVTGGYTTGWTAEDEAYTRADAALFLKCLEWAIQSGDQTPMVNFARGLFNTVGQRVFDAGKLTAFTYSFTHMRDSVIALSGVGTAADAAVTALVGALNATLTSPVTRREPSRITAIGHTWTGTMAGVALTKIPPAAPARSINESILETNEGVVVATGQDDYGNALLARGPNGTLEVDAQIGLTGSLFEAAVRQRALRAAIIGSF